MCVRLYIFKIEENHINNNLFESVINKQNGLSHRIITNINYMRRRQTYLAKKMCIFILDKYYDKQLSSVDFTYTEYGKPYLINHKGLFFNYSHTDDLIVVAISNNEVGVDVEYIDPNNRKLLKKILSKDELKLMCEGDVFYNNATLCWTIKESYLKQIGYGLLSPMNRITIKNTQEDNFYIINESHIRTYCINNIIISVSSKSKIFQENIEMIEEEEFIRYVLKNE